MGTTCDCYIIFRTVVNWTEVNCISPHIYSWLSVKHRFRLNPHYTREIILFALAEARAIKLFHSGHKVDIQ